MRVTIKTNLSSKTIKKLHQLHGVDIMSVSTVKEGDDVYVSAETSLDEASLLDRIEKFNPAKERNEELKEKVKGGVASNEERLELCEKLLGIV